MDLFSEILKNLPRDFLSDVQLMFILAFYADRTKDHHSVVPAILAGTLAMSRMENIPEEEFVGLFMTLISGSVTCQSQTRGDREIFYEIIEFCSRTYMNRLTSTKDEFLQGMIAALEGERDPRNLLRIFTFMPKVMELYPLGHWTEEMFEVFACYFPVDFHPPANVPNPITRDQLAERLLTCLTASKDFVEFAIPLAVEKLESQIKVSKLDSLQLLAKCAALHGAEPFEETFPNTWLSLKAEVMLGANEEVMEKALETIRTILSAAGTSKTLTENLLNVILHSVTISLCDTNLRLFAPACKVVVACCSSNSHASVCAANKLLPMFLAQILEEDTTDVQKRILLKFVSEIGGICREGRVLGEIDAGTREKMQEVFRDCFSNDAKFKEIAFEGLSQLSELLAESQRQVVYQNLLDTLQSGADIQVESVVRRFAQSHEEELTEKVVMNLLAKDFLNPSNSAGIFRCVVCLIELWKSSEILYRFLIESAFENPTSEIKLTALKSIQELLKESGDKTISQEFVSTFGIIEKIVKFLREQPDLPTEILLTTSDVLKLCVRTLNQEQQSEVLTQFLPDLAPHRGNELFLFDGLIGQLCPEVDVSAHFHQITKDLIEYAVEISRGEVSSSANLEVCNKLLCSLFNRSVQDSIFEETLSQSINYLNRQIEVNSLGIVTFAWIFKGLLVKGHRKTNTLIKDFVGHLNVDPLKDDTVAGFRVLAKSADDVNLPTVRPFHQQKLFELVLKNMVTQDKYTPSQLAALAEILLHLPMKVITINLPRIGQILFQCLECENNQTLLITLTLINRLLKEESNFCRNHLQTLIPRCLQLSTLKGSLVSNPQEILLQKSI